jgi:hypothetical protein
LAGKFQAGVYACARVSHFKKGAKNGEMREFVCAYEFKLKRECNDWKIFYVKYNLKNMIGNLELK